MEIPGLLGNIGSIYHGWSHWIARGFYIYKRKSESVSELCKMCNENKNKNIRKHPTCADFPNVIVGRRCYARDASDAMFRRTASLCLRFTWCRMRHDSAKRHIWGAMTPKFELSRDFLCNVPSLQVSSSYMFTHSEVIVLTHKPTNTPTNRRRRKHPTFFAQLRRWVKHLLILLYPRFNWAQAAPILRPGNRSPC